MKHIIRLLLLMFVLPLSAQNIVKMSAVKSNDYGVNYRLPKTAIKIQATVEKKTRKAGEYYQYAEKYFSLTNVIEKNEVSYTLQQIEVATLGVVDQNESYLVEFRSNTAAPYVTLTKDGLICAINAESDYAPAVPFTSVTEQVATKSADPRSYLSEEILRAGSSIKQAELIAKQIYRLRDTRNNILTGEADNMPPDGEAYRLVMSKLDEQEKALTSMFIGTEEKETMSKQFDVMPTEDNIDKRVIFRLSSKLGIVDADDLSGVPVYLSLTSKQPKMEAPVLTPKEQKLWDEKYAKGIIFNVPAKANLTVTFANQTLANKDCDIVQFGTQEVLTPKQLEYKKDAAIKVLFYPELGAIKQITE